jgi:Kef-type K+ transport system membrane component KefB
MLVLAQVVHMEMPEGPALPFLVLLLVVVLGPMIIERFRVPGIIGLLVGGLLIGPHALGVVGGGNTTVPDLGKIGLLYLMFIAGLELDLRLVQAHKKATLVYSSLTFVLPLTGGIIVGLALGFELSAAILLGSLLASHTLVVYPMIKDMGRGNDPAVATGVGATVVTDTLSLIVLAAVSGVTLGEAGGLEIAAQLVIGLAALFAGCFLVLPWITRQFLSRMGTARAARYVFALVAMLAAAVLAEAFGIEGIVGAFFAGLALNRLVPNEGDLMERIEFFGGAFFVPVFLVSVGLIIDPSVMTDPTTLRFAGVFIAACFGGKALAALLTRPLLGYSWPEAGVLFSLTIPQAAATLAATIVGFNIGLFGTEVVNAVLVLIAVSLVLSSAITPIFTRRLEGSHPDPGRLGRRVLLVLPPDAPVRRGVAALAVRLARSDDGIVVPVVVMGDTRSSGEDAWKSFESSLVLLGIDREVSICVDDDIADGVRHAAEAHHCTSVVIDDLDGAIHDDFGTDPLAQPVLFVGHLTDRTLTVAAVEGGHDGQPALVDLAGRLARDMGPLSGDSKADIIFEPAGSIEPDGDRTAAYVRVLSPADV